MNFIKIAQNHSFHENADENLIFKCVIRVSFAYIHLHTIGSICVAELGTLHFILRQINVDFTGRFLGGVASKNIFGKSLKSSLHLFIIFFNIYQIWNHHSSEHFSRK